YAGFINRFPRRYKAVPLNRGCCRAQQRRRRSQRLNFGQYFCDTEPAMIPPKNELVICFAHVAYRLDERFAALGTGIRSFAVCDPETLAARIGEADVLVISGLWNNALLDRASRLRFVQAIGAGTDQFPQGELKRRDVRLASARGVDADEVQPMGALNALLPDADFVALTCPLTPDTERLIDAAALARMKPSAYLVNLARGRVVDEAALVETLAPIASPARRSM